MAERRRYSTCVPGSRALVVDACTDRVEPGCSLALLQGHIPPVDETPESRGVRQLRTEVPYEGKTPTKRGCFGALFGVSLAGLGWADWGILPRIRVSQGRRLFRFLRAASPIFVLLFVSFYNS